MAEGLQLTAKFEMDGFVTNAAGVGEAVVDTIDIDKLVSYVTGSGAGGADGYFAAAINIAASGSQTWDLTSQTDPLGQALDFVRVKAVIVLADAANTNDIVLEGGASTPYLGPLGGTTPTLNVRPGGMALYMDPGATGYLTSGSNNLKLANSSSGSAVTGKLIVIGAKE